MNPVIFWWWSCYAYQKRIPFIARVLKAVNYILFKAILPFEAQIERDLRLEHYGLCVVIHPNVTLGRNVLIYHNVTLATETWIGSEHRIYVGNNVIIGAGAIVVARLHQSLYIGDNAKIGAGAVVTHDVEPGQTVIGSPAHPIGHDASK